jgi:hypothetical protein
MHQRCLMICRATLSMATTFIGPMEWATVSSERGSLESELFHDVPPPTLVRDRLTSRHWRLDTKLSNLLPTAQPSLTPGTCKSSSRISTKWTIAILTCHILVKMHRKTGCQWFYYTD